MTTAQTTLDASEVVWDDNAELAYAIGLHDGNADRDRLRAALETVTRGITPDLDTKDCEHLRSIARAALAQSDKGE